MQGFLDVERNPEGRVRRSSIQPVGRDARPGRAARRGESDDRERHRGHAPVRFRRGGDAVHPRLEGLERVQELGPAGGARRMRLEKVEKRGAFVAAPNLVLVAAAPGAQRQQVAALTGVGARLGEDPEQGLTRRRGDVNGVGQRGADRGGAPDVPQRRRRGRARRRLTFRPAQLEHGVWVEAEPRGERVHQRGVVLGEHAQRIAGFKVETPRAARVKLDVKHPSVGFWVGHELGLGNLREVRLLVRELVRARGWGGRVRAPGVPGEGRGVRPATSPPRDTRAGRGRRRGQPRSP